MNRHLQIAATLLLLATFSHCQDKNKIIGSIFEPKKSASSNQSPQPLEGMVVQALDTDKKPISSPQKTDNKGNFVLIIPPSFVIFRIMAYDPNAAYWIYKPDENRPNNTDQQDLGKIYLYPRSVRLSRDQVRQQIAAVNALESSDEQSAAKVKRAIFSDYPTEVQDQIRNALKADPALKNITVAVDQNGTVALNGAVDNTEQEQTARHVVQEYVGTIEVTGNLRVADAIQDKIQKAIQQDSTLANTDITPSVSPDKIELNGTVASKDQKKTVKQIAESNAGGIKVVDHLKVSGNNGASSTTPPPKN